MVEQKGDETLSLRLQGWPAGGCEECQRAPRTAWPSQQGHLGEGRRCDDCGRQTLCEVCVPDGRRCNFCRRRAELTAVRSSARAVRCAACGQLVAEHRIDKLHGCAKHAVCVDCVHRPSGAPAQCRDCLRGHAPLGETAVCGTCHETVCRACGWSCPGCGKVWFHRRFLCIAGAPTCPLADCGLRICAGCLPAHAQRGDCDVASGHHHLALADGPKGEGGAAAKQGGSERCHDCGRSFCPVCVWRAEPVVPALIGPACGRRCAARVVHGMQQRGEPTRRCADCARQTGVCPECHEVIVDPVVCVSHRPRCQLCRRQTAHVLPQTLVCPCAPGVRSGDDTRPLGPCRPHQAQALVLCCRCWPEVKSGARRLATLTPTHAPCASVRCRSLIVLGDTSEHDKSEPPLGRAPPSMDVGRPVCHAHSRRCAGCGRRYCLPCLAISGERLYGSLCAPCVGAIQYCLLALSAASGRHNLVHSPPVLNLVLVYLSEALC